MKGVMRQALAQNTPLVCIMDESEAYNVEQVMAACVVESFQTLVLVGDVNQRFDRRMPAFTRVPWVSSKDPCGQRRRTWND